MHSSQVLAGMDVFGYPEKTFDTSGKSGAGIHGPAICQMPMARATVGAWMRLLAKSLPANELAPARARRMLLSARSDAFAEEMSM